MDGGDVFLMLATNMKHKLVAANFGFLAYLLSPAACAQALHPGIDGKEIAFDRAKGNCLACHGFPTVPDAVQTGNSGPPIIAMQARFPDKGMLRGVIWDASASSASSFMPPFGKHQVLSEEEIDKVVDFVHGL
jgi:L-cysteine S-thiosulfotransferase